MKPTFQVSDDVISICGLLREIPIGGKITYEKIVKTVGKDIQGHYRHLVESARRKLLNDERIVFGCLRNLGYQRLDDSDKIKSGMHHLTKSRRSAKRSIKHTTSVDKWESLSPQDKLKHNGITAAAAAVIGLTSHSGIKRLTMDSNSNLESAKSAAMKLSDVK